MTRNPAITIATFPPFRGRRFSAPRSPYPWVWRCHKCRTVYRFSALNRCLSCSHRFCQKCVSEFDYSGWEHWKGYWRAGIDDKEKEKGNEDGEEVEEEEDDELEIEDVKEKHNEANGVVYEDVCIADLEQAAGTSHLWEDFEDVTSPCTRTSLEEQLQLQLSMHLDHTPVSLSPTSPPRTLSHYSTSSEDDDDDDDEWRPSAYYLQRSASVSTLDVGVHGLNLAFRDEDIDPELRGGYSSVQEARKALDPYSSTDGVYGTGEEGETMRDWPAPSEQTGYRSVQEARKALHSYAVREYGTGEAGEPMRDWTSEFNYPSEAGAVP